jgi:hypothetical protein
LKNFTEYARQDSKLNSQSLLNKELIKLVKSRRVQNPVQISNVLNELQQVIGIWPILSEKQRQAVLAMLSAFDSSDGT